MAQTTRDTHAQDFKDLPLLAPCLRVCVGVRVLVRVHVDKDGLWNVQKRKEFWKIKKVRSASVTDIRQKVSQSAV